MTRLVDQIVKDVHHFPRAQDNIFKLLVLSNQQPRDICLQRLSALDVLLTLCHANEQ